MSISGRNISGSNVWEATLAKSQKYTELCTERIQYNLSQLELPPPQTQKTSTSRDKPRTRSRKGLKGVNLLQAEQRKIRSQSYNVGGAVEGYRRSRRSDSEDDDYKLNINISRSRSNTMEPSSISPSHKPNNSRSRSNTMESCSVSPTHTKPIYRDRANRPSTATSASHNRGPAFFGASDDNNNNFALKSQARPSTALLQAKLVPKRHENPSKRITFSKDDNNLEFKTHASPPSPSLPIARPGTAPLQGIHDCRSARRRQVSSHDDNAMLVPKRQERSSRSSVTTGWRNSLLDDEISAIQIDDDNNIDLKSQASPSSFERRSAREALSRMKPGSADDTNLGVKFQTSPSSHAARPGTAPLQDVRRRRNSQLDDDLSALQIEDDFSLDFKVEEFPFSSFIVPRPGTAPLQGIHERRSARRSQGSSLAKELDDVKPLITVKRPSAIERRNTKMETEKTLLEESILKKSQRSAVLKAQEVKAEQAKKWFTIVALINTTQTFMQKSTMNIAINDNREVHIASALIIQNLWSIYYAPLREKKNVSVQTSLQKFIYRIKQKLYQIRCNLAANQILRFQKDHRSQRIRFIMVKFRFHVVRVQRGVRQYQACTRARVLALGLAWDWIERELQKRVEGEKVKVGVAGGAGGAGGIGTASARLMDDRFGFKEKIRKVTKDCNSLRMSIQKGLTRSRISRPNPGNKIKIVPDKVKHDALGDWLLKARIEHGRNGYRKTRGTSVKVKQIDVADAMSIMAGTMDIREHVDYSVVVRARPTFCMLTRGREGLVEIVEGLVREWIEKGEVARRKEIEERIGKESGAGKGRGAGEGGERYRRGTISSRIENTV